MESFRGGFSGNERDRFFYNPDSGERFYATAYALGLDFADDGRSYLPIDFDGDGDLDIARVSLQGLRLLENTLDRGGRSASPRAQLGLVRRRKRLHLAAEVALQRRQPLLEADRRSRLHAPEPRAELGHLWTSGCLVGLK